MDPFDEAGTRPGVGSPDGAGLLPRVGEYPGFTLARVSVVLVAGMFGLALTRVGGLPAWAILTVLVCWCITWAHPWTALAAATEAWAVQTGFGVHRYGELTFGRGDLTRLGAVVAATVLVSLLTRRGSDPQRAVSAGRSPTNAPPTNTSSASRRPPGSPRRDGPVGPESRWRR